MRCTWDFSQRVGAFEMTEPTMDKCAGCILKPEPGGNYDWKCAECSRFYGDHYESKIKRNDDSNFDAVMESISELSNCSE